MSFDQNMIIDATTGSIARFVNHSCNPNCRMVKWIVGGNPRMALFAGDRPIMTGEELTYDYKFDPFSAKNVQTCLCGEANCRGVLGPKPKSEVKGDVGTVVKAGVKAGKRKLKELLGEEKGAVKKRRVGGKATGSAKGQGQAKAKGAEKGQAKGKGAEKAKAKGTAGKGKAKSPVKARKPTAAKAPLKKTLAGRVRKTYGRAKSEVQLKTTPKASTAKASVSVKEGKKSRMVSLSAKRSRENAGPSSPKGKEGVGAEGGKGSPVSKSGRVRRLTVKAAGEE